jgi:hypothetical protein
VESTKRLLWWYGRTSRPPLSSIDGSFEHDVINIAHVREARVNGAQFLPPIKEIGIGHFVDCTRWWASLLIKEFMNNAVDYKHIAMLLEGVPVPSRGL